VEHIEKDFGLHLPILKTDVPCRYGIESTILIWKEDLWHIGRFGAISPKSIEKVLGYELKAQKEGKKPLCPGQLFRHYAPQANLTLSFAPWNPENARHFDGVLGFRDRHYLNAQTVVTMGDSEDPESANSRLYAALRELDAYSLRSVFVDLHIPITSDWLAIADRLYKASSQ
jgi:L-threonylcarbamoyladenylate synthase